MFKWLFVMLVTFNVRHGPWGSSARWRESQERMSNLAEGVDPVNMPAFVDAVLAIAAELAIPLIDPDVTMQCWQRTVMDGHLIHKGYKCNFNRFYGAITEAEAAIKEINQRAYITQHVSLESDYLSGLISYK